MTMVGVICAAEAVAATGIAIVAVLRAEGWKTSSALWIRVARDTGAALVEAEAELARAQLEREHLRGVNESLLFDSHRRGRRRTQETDTSG